MARVAPTVELRAERMVAGGRALSRDREGRIVLVRGALPGERVRAATYRRHGTDHGEVVEVLETSADRVTPPCPYVDLGCGGCDWQHIAPDRQRLLRRDIVTDALRRLGRLEDPAVSLGPPIDAERTRNSLRVAVVDGRLGLRAEASHDVVPIADCLVAHPAIAELLAPGAIDPGTATELTVRVATDADGTVTGRLLVAAPTAAGVRAPDDVTVVGIDELAAGHRVWFRTHLAGVDFRVSARSFLQGRGAGVEALVDVARTMLAEAPAGPFLDLYGGIGLFAATLAGDRAVVLVERSKSAAADARTNLAHLPGGARVIAQPVERWKPGPASVVVADPARSGLGAAGVAKVAACGAERAVLVSCDAASLGRDTAALGRAGYRHVESVVLDLFGHTSHVEVVSRFDRADAGLTGPT